MINMFGDSTLNGARTLEKAALEGRPVEMENWFSRHTLDIIGKAVFDFDFNSLTHDDPVIEVSLAITGMATSWPISARVTWAMRVQRCNVTWPGCAILEGGPAPRSAYNDMLGKLAQHMPAPNVVHS